MGRMKRLYKVRWLLIVLVFYFHPFPIHGASRQYVHSTGTDQRGRAVEMEEVVGILEAYFQRIYPAETHRIEIKSLRGYEKVVLPPGLSSYEIILPERVQRGGNISATVLFWVDRQEIKRLKVTARVDIYADVVTVRYPLKRHHVIEAKDLYLTNRNIALFPPDVVTEMSEVLGKRTTLSINNNEILRAGMVEVPPIIKKGDRVILLIENPHIKITTFGESKEEGRRGDRVKLINLSSRKEVYGKVLDANTVRIDF